MRNNKKNNNNRHILVKIFLIWLLWLAFCKLCPITTTWSCHTKGRLVYTSTI